MLVLGVVVVERFFAGRKWDSLRSIARLGIAGCLGLALASPLLLPGAQLITHSVRSQVAALYSLPKSVFINFAFASFYGFPTNSTHYFGPSNYYETAAFVGPTAIVLAVLGLWSRWRRVEVSAIGVALIALVGIVFTTIGVKVVGSVPGLSEVVWTRALVAIDLLLSVLAGVGLSVVMDREAQRKTKRRFVAVSMLALMGIGAICVVGVTGMQTGVDRSIREQSLVWPCVSLLITGGASLLLVGGARRRGQTGKAARPRHAGGRRGASRVLLAVIAVAGAEVAFLLTAAPTLEPSSHVGFVPTRAEVQLEKAVGSARVGFETCPSLVQVPSLGILPEANGVYHVAEIAAYDPILPDRYFSVWDQASGQPPLPTAGTFCPSITSAALARVFGVSFVLGPVGSATPTGTRRVGEIGGENLFQVPASGTVMLKAIGSRASLLKGDSRAVRVRYGGGGRVTFAVKLAHSESVRINVTDLPGWRATVDGRAVALHPTHGLYFLARLPAGTDRVTLTYWPRLFSVGLVLAVVAALILAVGGLLRLMPVARRRSGRGGARELEGSRERDSGASGLRDSGNVSAVGVLSGVPQVDTARSR